jgi:hypothetical protein
MKKRQQGMTTVEAAIGGVLMMIMLFGTIEIARAIFVWNFLDEVTRRGARVAAVCPIDRTDDAIAKRVAIFAPPGGPNQSPVVNELSTDDLDLEYLDAAGVDNGTEFEDVKFVRVSIPSFELRFLFFNALAWTTPDFLTILPSESLGYNPDLNECSCLGGAPTPFGVAPCG